MEREVSMTKRSHSIYFDRMINFSLLIQNGDVWGELGKYLILSNIDYLEKSFCVNPNTLSYLCFEMAQQKLSNSLVEVLHSLNSIRTLYFKARR